MRRHKFLFCHNHYQSAGGESLVFDQLVRGLRERGHPVTTYVRHNDALGDASWSARAQAVAGAYWSRRTARELTALVKADRPDVAIIQNVMPLISPSAYSTLHALGIPIVQVVYNYRLVSPAAELYSRGSICEKSIGGNYLHCIVRRCYRDSVTASAWYASVLWWHRQVGTFSRTISMFQVPDHFMASKLAGAGFREARMVRNVNPFFVGDFQPAFGHDRYVVYVGRIIRQKGVVTLVDAIARSRHGRAVLVGDGGLLPELRRRVAAGGLADRIMFTGPLWGARATAVMAKATAVVIPSEWYDNLPLALCQANALGKPVIASAINGIPEYVQPGVNGALFSPGDVAQLADEVDRMLALPSDVYRKLSADCRRYAERHLDFDHHYRVLMEGIERLCLTTK